MKINLLTIIIAVIFIYKLVFFIPILVRKFETYTLSPTSKNVLITNQVNYHYETLESLFTIFFCRK